jgi:hypothetical protein
MWQDILRNNAVIWIAMSIIIFIFTQLIKLPIKWATSHFKNEKVRVIVNTLIYLIPFGVGIGLDFVYSTFVLNIASSITNGLQYALSAMALYSTIERFLKIKVENPYDTEHGKAVVEMVVEVSKDKKIDKNDSNAVKDFWKKVK